MVLARLFSAVLALAMSAPAAFAFARLSESTKAAFDRYVEAAESRMNRDLQPDNFLFVDNRSDFKSKVRNGELLIEPGTSFNGGKEGNVPNGMLQDWVGLMFIPQAIRCLRTRPSPTPEVHSPSPEAANHPL